MSPRSPLFRALLISCSLAWVAIAQADDEPPALDGGTNGPVAGHSLHGEAFNEGPRQSAVLMPGTGNVKLTITTSNPQAQAFFNQGLGQLHGFWFFEAERSFRQVAFLDTNCAMAHWGMALSNPYNTNRAAEFIRKAHALKTNATPREVLWIEAYHDYFTGKDGEKERRSKLVKALENIVQEHPEELEAKTFLAFQVWMNEGEGISIASRQAVDSLMNEVLAVEPMHPIHHARIHTWNYKKDQRALNSAARCGQSAPGIAHMWHMPGHTYSALKRFDDAAWQQEASARTDHAYMMAARILPDQIHNFAHNNEWLCSNLLYCGRVKDAIALARNMIELPRHPKYNTLNRKDDNSAYDKNNGSSMKGRERLLDAFLAYELWPDMTALADTFYLEPTELPEEQARRLYALSLAQFAQNHPEAALERIQGLDACLNQLKRERFEAAEKAETESKKKKEGSGEANKAMVKAMEGFNGRLERVENYRAELKVWTLLSKGETNQASTLLEESKQIPKKQRARLWSALGNRTNTIHLASELGKDSTNEAPALALAAHLLWRAGESNQATNFLHQLRSISSRFDLETPILARLAPIALAAGLPSDWRVPVVIKEDVGNRPPLDSLGPFRWQPFPAPSWALLDAQRKEHSLAEYRGRAVLVVFYLGAGCVHCVEQLNQLAPVTSDFGAEGVSVVAIGTDSPEGLERTTKKATGKAGFPFPILSDPSFTAFKAYRAYDDFEQMALHGAFLVDEEGRIRWQDIGPDPFTDFKFLLKESRRLLGLTRRNVARR